MKLVMRIFLLSLCLFPANVFAACSDITGDAFFNEVYATQAGGGFLEVVTIDSEIGPELPKVNDWTVYWCLGETKCNTLYFTKANTSDAFGDYYFHYFRESEGFDVKANDLSDFQAVLLDGSGADAKAIDFLKIDADQDTYASILNKLSGCTFAHNTSPPSADSNDRHFYRDPDGIGDWVTNLKPGASSEGDITTGSPNNPDEIPPADPPSLHHIRIEHSGLTGVTCLTEAVTVRACSNEECDPYLGDPIEVVLTASGDGNFLTSPVDVADQPVTVRLRKETASSTAIWATAVAATNSTRCFIDGSEQEMADCTVTFDAVGIVIDGDYPGTDVVDDIPTQIAGKSSLIGWNGAEQRIRVVRTDDNTGACVAAVENKILEVSFSYGVPVLAEGLADNLLNVGGTDIASASGEGTVTLTFDSAGTATFSFVAQDAGRYNLSAALDLPITDESGEPDPLAQTIRVSTSSNAFVVRPLAVFADATANPKAQSATGDAYKKAGESFPLTFKSLRWTPGLDGDSDGLWDSCGDTNLTDPGSYARVPAWIIDEPAGDLVLPAGGNNPDLNYGDGNVAFVAGESEAIANNVSYPEVGIVQIQTNGLNTFFGANVEVCSPYIGRFIPDRFEIEDVLPGTLNSACNTFTYTGQTIKGYVVGGEPKFTIRALSALEPVQTTQNYTGDFAKLEAADIDLSGPLGGADADQLGADEENKVLVDTWLDIGTLTDNSDGTLTYTASSGDEYMYLRDNARISPFDARILLHLDSIEDIDGVSAIGLPLDVEVAGTEIRFGRVSLENAYGSELLDLNLPLKTEYFNQGWFQTNTDDDCTELNLADHMELNLDKDDETGWVAGTSSIVVGGGSTSATIGNSPVESGDAGLVFTSPGAENDGSFYVRTNIGGDYPWLLFDWNNDGNQTNPSAKATFGIFKGNPRLIYMRESVW